VFSVTGKARESFLFLFLLFFKLERVYIYNQVPIMRQIKGKQK
jgi:hypothetical protein